MSAQSPGRGVSQQTGSVVLLSQSSKPGAGLGLRYRAGQNYIVPLHGEPTWFVRDKKTFVMFADHHHDDRLAFWCAAPPGAQDVLLAAAPQRYFRPPYVGHRGWLGVYLDVPVDWDEIATLVEDAYRCVAPNSLVALIPPARLGEA